MEILAALSALLGVGTGIFQLFSSDKAGKEAGERPMYETPPEVDQSVNIAKQQAYGDMPGLETAKQNIEQSGAAQYNKALNTASSGSDVLGFMSGQSLAQNRSMNQLGDMNAAYKDQGLDKLKAALGMKAQYGTMEQQDNLNRWQELKGEQAVEEEGGIQNIFNAVSGYGSNMMAMKQNQQYMDLLNKMYGSGGTSPSGTSPSGQNYSWNTDFLKSAGYGGQNFLGSPWGGYGQEFSSQMFGNLWKTN